VLSTQLDDQAREDYSSSSSSETETADDDNAMSAEVNAAHAAT